MRPLFTFVVLLAAGLVLWGAFRLKQGLEAPRSPTLVQGANLGPGAPVASAPPPEEPRRPVAAPQPAPVVAPPPEVPATTPESLEAQIERLERLAMNGDPASLSEIVQAFASPEKKVRSAAIEAAKEFGSTNAIPALKAAAESVADLKEKVAFLEAADFLSLPPASLDASPVALTPEQEQVRAERRAQRQVRRQLRLLDRAGVSLDLPASPPPSSPASPP